MKRFIFAAFVCIALAASAFADTLYDLAVATGDPKSAPAVIARLEREGGAKAALYVGIVQHNLATADPGLAGTAIATLKAYWEKTGDPLALAYYGSAVTLRASALSASGDMFGATAAIDEGFKLMDRAVALAPENRAIRFLRAENGMSVAEASPFKRYDAVAADLAAIEPGLAALPADEKAHWWLLSGRLAQARGKLGEAVKAYEQAIRAAPDSPSAAAAKKRLSRLEE